MGFPKRRLWNIALIVALVAAACASEITAPSTAIESEAQPELDSEADSPTVLATDLEELMEQMGEDARTSIPEISAETGELEPREIEGADADAITKIAAVEAFWIDVGSEIGLEYEPLDSQFLIPRSVLAARGTQDCTFNGAVTELNADMARFNAFVAPCQEGITVVWDDIELKARLDARFPEAGFAHLMAHEWGHVAQQQSPRVQRSTLLGEQQADCYAGAFVAWAEDRGISPFTTPRARDLAIISALETRDRVGSSPAAANAHGNGFDRTRAAQEGYDSGVAFCAGYDTNPPPITQMTFSSQAEANSAGNLATADAVALIEPALAAYFQSLTDTPIDPFVPPIDLAQLDGINRQIGDGGVATLLGLGYAGALQASVGEDPNGIEPALRRACLFGTFLNQTLNGAITSTSPDGTVTALNLSPGDLDETIMTLTNSPTVISNPGLVFEIVAALRIGTIEGLNGCLLNR